MTGSIFLSIGWRFYLQYFKGRKTTCVKYFFGISIDLSLFFYSFALLRHRRSPEISVTVFLWACVVMLSESPCKMAV
jgi:hypothetical protein